MSQRDWQRGFQQQAFDPNKLGFRKFKERKITKRTKLIKIQYNLNLFDHWSYSHKCSQFIFQASKCGYFLACLAIVSSFGDNRKGTGWTLAHTEYSREIFIHIFYTGKTKKISIFY